MVVVVYFIVSRSLLNNFQLWLTWLPNRLTTRLVEGSHEGHSGLFLFDGDN